MDILFWPKSHSQWEKSSMKNEEKRKIMEFVKDQYFGCIDVKNEEEK